jgi:hypothetical protein
VEKILFPVEKVLFPVEKLMLPGENTVFRKCRSGYSRPNNAHSLIAAEQRAELTKASALTPFIMAASVCHP